MFFLKRFYTLLIIIFLVYFPKGGFKVGNIPITWGYLLLIFSVPLCFFSRIKSIAKNRWNVLILTLPFILYSFIVVLLRWDGNNLGFTLSFFLSLLIMPFIFLVFYDNVFESITFNKVFPSIFLWGIRFVILFGIFLFFYRFFIGVNFEIPYLTVNVDDNMEEKNNNRQGISKLYSTYNNGNLYGISMLLLTSLFLKYEKNKIFKILFFISLFLTLSRTVWIGVLLYFMLFIFTNFFRGKNIFYIVLLTIILLIGFPFLLDFMGKDITFLMDKNLGGRKKQLNVLDDISWFGEDSFKGISEIVYISVVNTFGIVGLLLFLLYLLSPIIIFKLKKMKGNIHWGILIYLVICLSDGAILLIPVMCFFWFISSYMFKKEFK